ncbi:MAG TPA: LysE family translocator [Candidatus Nitrosotalea sp.]|nr:LysE family translocator [Candidatus Nitrosotalea sp.]
MAMFGRPSDIMPLEQVVGFVLFAVAAAGTPGPSNVLLTAAGASAGVLRGLPCLLGVSGGMGVMMSVVAFGLGSAVLGNPTVLRALNWLGAAFLLWLAWKIATARRSDAAGGSRPVGFVGAAAFQWINPKSWLVCASAAGTYLHAGSGSALPQAAALGALFILASLPCCFVWLAFGASAQRLLRTERARRTFNIAMGLLLAGSVALIM